MGKAPLFTDAQLSQYRLQFEFDAYAEAAKITDFKDLTDEKVTRVAQTAISSLSSEISLEQETALAPIAKQAFQKAYASKKLDFLNELTREYKELLEQRFVVNEGSAPEYLPREQIIRILTEKATKHGLTKDEVEAFLGNFSKIKSQVDLRNTLNFLVNFSKEDKIAFLSREFPELDQEYFGPFLDAFQQQYEILKREGSLTRDELLDRVKGELVMRELTFEFFDRVCDLHEGLKTLSFYRKIEKQLPALPPEQIAAFVQIYLDEQPSYEDQSKFKNLVEEQLTNKFGQEWISQNFNTLFQIIYENSSSIEKSLQNIDFMLKIVKEEPSAEKISPPVSPKDVLEATPGIEQLEPSLSFLHAEEVEEHLLSVASPRQINEIFNHLENNEPLSQKQQDKLARWITHYQTLLNAATPEIFEEFSTHNQNKLTLLSAKLNDLVQNLREVTRKEYRRQYSLDPFYYTGLALKKNQRFLLPLLCYLPLEEHSLINPIRELEISKENLLPISPSHEEPIFIRNLEQLSQEVNHFEQSADELRALYKKMLIEGIPPKKEYTLNLFITKFQTLRTLYLVCHEKKYEAKDKEKILEKAEILQNIVIEMRRRLYMQVAKDQKLGPYNSDLKVALEKQGIWMQPKKK